MELRISPNDPQFAEIDFLVRYYVALKNPQVHFDLKGTPEAERLAEISRVEDLLEQLSR